MKGLVSTIDDRPQSLGSLFEEAIQDLLEKYRKKATSKKG